MDCTYTITGCITHRSMRYLSAARCARSLRARCPHPLTARSLTAHCALACTAHDALTTRSHAWLWPAPALSSRAAPDRLARLSLLGSLLLNVLLLPCCCCCHAAAAADAAAAALLPARSAQLCSLSSARSALLGQRCSLFSARFHVRRLSRPLLNSHCRAPALGCQCRLVGWHGWAVLPRIWVRVGRAVLARWVSYLCACSQQLL